MNECQQKAVNARYGDKPGILVPTTGGSTFQAYNEGWGFCDNEPGLKFIEWLDESETPELLQLRGEVERIRRFRCTKF